MKRFAAPTGVFILLLAVYLWTMAPGIFWIDSAAFTACNEILGLPHSPSFPAYTVMGRTLHALLPVDPATASNLFSAVTAAAAGAIFYLILRLLLQPSAMPEKLKFITSFTGALFAFTAVPIWQSAVRAEVYALQVLISLAIIYSFLKCTRETDSPGKYRWALAAVFFQGLAFANHSLLALITIPLIMAIPFTPGFKAAGGSFMRFAVAGTALFCIALSFYLYLPIRSNQDPFINSGQPKTLSLTLKAITRTGEDYMPDMNPAPIDYFARIKNLGKFIFNQTGVLAILGLVAGLFIAARRKNVILLLLIGLIPLGWALTIWAADFELMNFDIVAYSALPLALFIMMAFYGLSHLAAKAMEKSRLGHYAVVVLIFMVYFQFSENLNACDLSGSAGPDRLAEIILEEAPPHAILMLNEDNVVLPLWYHCLALNQRRDLKIIATGAMYRPSYRDELRTLYPNLKFPPEFEAYKIDNFNRAVKKFCDLNSVNHPIMVQFGVPGIDAASLMPAGFLFRYNGGAFLPEPGIKMPMPELLDYIADGATDLLTREFAARNAFNYGVYFDRLGQTRESFRFFRYAIETDDQNPSYFLRLGIAFLNAGRQDEAIILLKQATLTGSGCPEADRLLKQITDREYGQR